MRVIILRIWYWQERENRAGKLEHGEKISEDFGGQPTGGSQ